MQLELLVGCKAVRKTGLKLLRVLRRVTVKMVGMFLELLTSLVRSR